MNDQMENEREGATSSPPAHTTRQVQQDKEQRYLAQDVTRGGAFNPHTSEKVLGCLGREGRSSRDEIMVKWRYGPGGSA